MGKKYSKSYLKLLFNMIKKDWEAIFSNIKAMRFGVFWKAILHIILRNKNHDGVNVVEEEWDNLIVLDSCRYDAFEKVNFIPGNLEAKTSQGTTTIQWLNQNFTEYYDDIVYLSPVVWLKEDNHKDFNYQRKRFESSKHFHAIEMLHDNEEGIEQGKHSKLESAVKKAEHFAEKYPDKRKIIHFSQPHLGFVTSNLVEENHKFYRQYLDEGYSWAELKKEYENSLKFTLKHVEKLIEKLEGKTVITADHGEAHGEYGLRDHPHSVYIKPLVKVPWLEVEN
jgi:hypothetical protein